MNRKTALITGASKGIGKGTAICLAKAGYDLGINYNSDREGAEDTAEKVRSLGRKAVVIKANVKELYDIKNMFDEFFREFDRIDLLVNNAGITKGAPFLSVTPELWENVINTDLRGPFFCAQHAARKMVESNIKGVIINISSNHAFGCFPNSTVYATAKAGINKLTANMALDLSEFGIRVVTIAPGCTELEWFDENMKKRYVEPVSAKIPMRRFATVEEIGEAVVYLASEKAGFITGTTLLIDGGALLPVHTIL